MSTERFDSTATIISSTTGNSSTERVDNSFISSVKNDNSGLVGKEMTLNNKTYTVVSQIASSGEAEVFKVEHEGKPLVLKYYFSNYKPKDEVIKKLQQIKRQDIIYPIEYGYNQDRFWETNEYMEGGTLADEFPVRDISRFKDIVRQVTEAIHGCHANQIIHRDIKPVNVFFRHTDKRNIVLGDFGIASPLVDGNDYRVTTVARTTTYAAPELFTNINNMTTLDNSVDYYALGISLLEMWIGEDPFKNISQFNIMRIKNEGRVFIPADIHSDIENLIKGLITTEPPKRWSYEQVQKWLRGEPVKIFYQTRELKFSTYEFDAMQGITVNDPKELAYYMEKNLKKAERQLYSGAISNWIKSGSEDLYSEVYDIVEKSYKGTSDENIEAGITKTIYLFDKDRPFKSFNGEELYSAAELGSHIEKHTDHFTKDLALPAAKMYLFLEARGLQDRADKYRKYFKQLPPARAFKLVVLDLQDNKLKFAGHDFENLSQLSNAPAEIQQQLLQEIANPDSKVSVWLAISFPQLSDSLDKWRRIGNQTMETLRYALNTNGYRLNGKEALTDQEFYTMFTEMLPAFTTDAGAAHNRQEADHWLINYQQSSLAEIFGAYMENEPTDYSSFVIMYEFIFARQKGVNPFDMLTELTEPVMDVVEDNEAHLKAITEITKTSIIDYIETERPKHVFALEIMEEMGRHIADVKKVYPAFAESLLLSLNDKIDQYIHQDLTSVQKNSNSFDEYNQHLTAFATNDIALLSPGLPYYRHWQDEQQLIGKQIQNIETKISKEKEKEVQVVNSKYDNYLKTNIESSIDYLQKGKSFFSIYLIMLGCAIAFLYFQSAMVSMDGKVWSFVIGLVILLVTRWIVRSVKRRTPDSGIGMFADPIHRVVGKVLYRPIYKKLRNDPNSQLNLQTQQTRTSELQKIDTRSDGKRVNEIFEESVRIMLLDKGQLQSELLKNK